MFLESRALLCPFAVLKIVILEKSLGLKKKSAFLKQVTPWISIRFRLVHDEPGAFVAACS